MGTTKVNSRLGRNSQAGACVVSDTHEIDCVRNAQARTSRVAKAPKIVDCLCGCIFATIRLSRVALKHMDISHFHSSTCAIPIAIYRLRSTDGAVVTAIIVAGVLASEVANRSDTKLIQSIIAAAPDTPQSTPNVIHSNVATRTRPFASKTLYSRRKNNILTCARRTGAPFARDHNSAGDVVELEVGTGVCTITKQGAVQTANVAERSTGTCICALANYVKRSTSVTNGCEYRASTRITAAARKGACASSR